MYCNTVADVLQLCCRCIATVLQMYCNCVAIIFRMYTVCIQCVSVCISVYTVCIQCVYSVYTVCISVYTVFTQLSHSCKEVVDTTTYSYSQLIIQVAQSYAILQLSCNFKNTVNTAEFRIHTIILQMCCNVVATTYTANTTKYNSSAIAMRLVDIHTVIFSNHTSSVATLLVEYNSLAITYTLLTHYLHITYTANFAFTQCSHNHLTVAKKLIKRCNRVFHLLVHRVFTQ